MVRLTPIVPHVDYFKATVWASCEDVQSVLEDGILTDYYMGKFDGWIDRGAACRISSTWEAAKDIRVLVYRSFDYVSVEIKGEGCSRLGFQGLSQLYLNLGVFRRRASRLDIAWDGVPFTVQDVKQAAKCGDFKSRSITADEIAFYENKEGTTVYLGNRRSERFVRVYDRRGPVRFELELKGACADSAASYLVRPWCEAEAWFWGWVRHTVEFIDSRSNVRRDRCALLPWWLMFVEGHEGVKVYRAAQEASETLEPLGMAERAVIHSARRLEAYRRVMGDAYVLKRIGEVAGGRWSTDDEAFVRELMLSARAAGVLPPDDVPF